MINKELLSKCVHVQKITLFSSYLDEKIIMYTLFYLKSESKIDVVFTVVSELLRKLRHFTETEAIVNHQIIT